MKKLISNILVIPIILALNIFTLSTNFSSAQNVDGFNIIPEVDDKEITEINAKIKRIGSEGGHVWDHYTDEADQLSTSAQLASGIMNRDTILNYLVFVIKFLSQIGLLVGLIFIMYAGYKYMVSVFNSGKTPSSTIKNAIIGVLIVIFSYAIMRILTSLIGMT